MGSKKMKKNKRNAIKHILALLLFCMVMSIGMVSLADEKGTVIAKSAVIRAAADPNSQKLASVPSGKVIDVIGKATGTDNNKWYQVYVDGNTKGYIRGDLLKVNNDANLPSVDGGNASASQPADTTAAPVTPTEGMQVTVISNNTNIRSDASTTSASMAKANRGSPLTVIGETTGADGKKWYQVSFSYQNEQKTGFIRADLVTADNVPADTATSQITGEENPGEGEQPPETPPEGEQPPETPPEAEQSANDAITLLNVDTEPPYIMAEFKPLRFKLPGGDEEYNGYANGNFLICYARKSDGEEGWFLLDREQNVFQRYVYTADGVVVPKGGIGSIGLVPVIVLVVIIIVLVAVVGFLVLKLKGQGGSYRRHRRYDDDDEEQDDDIEDLEEIEDDDEEMQPARRPQGPQARRPQGQQFPGNPSANNGGAPQGQQPPRRPQGQQPPRYPQGQQPPRRPGSPANGQVSQGAQQKRPQPQGGSSSGNGGVRPQGGNTGQPPRRPQPQGGNAGQPPRRPQPQNERGQKGVKAKNFTEDDDMDFMDIE